MGVPAAGDRPEVVPDKVVAALDRIARGARAHRQATATRLGITPLQAELARILADGEPPQAQTAALAVEVGVSQPTASDALAALERKGFVRRSPTAGDRRRTTLRLTRSGTRLVEELRLSEVTLRDAVAALSSRDQQTLLPTLLGLISVMLEHGVIDQARTCPSCRFFDGGPAPRCALLKVRLAVSDLRVNCPEHEATRSA